MTFVNIFKPGKFLFRLILVLLITVTSIFLYVLLFGVFDSIEDVMKNRVLEDLDNMEIALFNFKKNNGIFPKELKELKGKYLHKIPVDPWKDEYIYFVTSNADGYILRCCKNPSITIVREK